MDVQITVTPGQILAGFVALCAAFSAVALAGSWVIKIFQGIRQPEENQNKRLSDVEAELEKHRGFLARDKDRLDAIEEGNRVSMRAQLALLSHSLDGNDVEALKESKKELQEYLIKR
jgi:hypothetical protein